MSRKIGTIFIVMLIPVLSLCAKADDIKVSAGVPEPEVYTGQNFQYQIIIEGVDHPGEVNLENLKPFNPQYGGGKDVSQVTTIIVQGKTQIQEKKQYIMVYSLTAPDKGTMVIPPVEVKLNGKIYKTNEVKVSVIEPGRTNRIALEVRLSKNECYLGEPIEISVDWLIREELSRSIGDFSLNVPVFVNEDFEKADSAEAADSAADRYQIDNVNVPAVASKRKIDNLNYFVISFRKIIIPQKTGRYDFDKCRVSADIVVGKKKRGFFGFDPQYKRFLAESEPFSINVLPLPEENVPAGFYGLVGRYSIETSASPKKVYVGDPVNFEISIKGPPYMKNIRRPAVENMPEFADNFKLPARYELPKTQNGVKTFSITIRAGNSDVERIPSVPLVFFDTQKAQYVTIESKPIPLDVMKTEVTTFEDVEGNTGFTRARKELEMIREGISANYSGNEMLVNETATLTGLIARPAYASLLIASLLLPVLTGSVKLASVKSPEKMRRKKHKKALADAVKELSALDKNQDVKRDGLTRIMRTFIGRRFDRSPAALNADECERIITEQTGGEETGALFGEIFRDCEQSVYSGSAANVDAELIDRLSRLIREIDRKAER